MDVSVNLTGGAFIVTMLVGLAVYAYIAYSLMTIAHKTDTSGGWMAWLPVFNLYLMCRVAGKPAWWLLLILFVPIVNVVLALMLWMKIAEARGFPGWVGILMIVPVLNFFIPGYLAFAEHREMPTGTPVHHS